MNPSLTEIRESALANGLPDGRATDKSIDFKEISQGYKIPGLQIFGKVMRHRKKKMREWIYFQYFEH